MHFTQYISILFVFLGTLCMIASLVMGTVMRRGVPAILRSKWSAMTFLILFFMVGYMAFLVIQLRRITFPLEILTSTVFLGGAIFVLLVMRLTKVTIAKVSESEKKISEVNTILIVKNRELETEIEARRVAEKKAKTRLQHLDVLHRIDLMITSSLDLQMTMTIFLEQIVPQLNADAAAILLLNPYTQTLEYGAGIGFTTSAMQKERIRMGEGPAGVAALERRIIQIDNMNAPEIEFSRLFLIREEKFRDYCVLPLISKGRVKGVLEIFRYDQPISDPERLEFLQSLSAQAAIAIDNASMFNELQITNTELIIAYDSTIEGWGQALDLRDKETRDHTRRVTDMTLHIASIYGMSEKEMVHARRGALLHDIGKMGIPDVILMKEGRFTREEKEIMQKHPLYAFEILSPISYLRPALDIPYCHHEKWDGTGYPRKLKGEEIPIAARIFALVDNWDALISERRYREAWPREQVVEFFRSQSGKHFDPDLVEVFLANI